jgi:hypothetical protein
VGREGIARKAERADPEARSHIYLAGPRSARGSRVSCSHRGLPEWIQNRSARRFADDGLELQQGRVGLLLQRCVESTDRDDETRSFLLSWSYHL